MWPWGPHVLPPGAMVTSGFKPQLKAMSGSSARLQLQSVLMSMAPVINKGREDRAAQSCPCPSSNLSLGCGTWVKRPCTSPGQHSKVDPVDGNVNEQDPRKGEWEIWPSPSSAIQCGVGEQKMAPTAWSRCKSWSWGRETERAVLPLTSCSSQESGKTTELVLVV